MVTDMTPPSIFRAIKHCIHDQSPLMISGKQPLAGAFQRIAVFDLAMDGHGAPMVAVPVLDLDWSDESGGMTKVS